MTNLASDRNDPRGRRWTGTLWGVLGGILLAPLIVMQFSSEMAWTASDFALFGVMLLAVGGLYEVAARNRTARSCRLATALSLATGFFLVWLTLAVGIVGTESNPANLAFAGIPAVAIVGALVARLRPSGMAIALVATAAAQIAAGIATGSFLAGLAFAVLWLTSAWLFRRAI